LNGEWKSKKVSSFVVSHPLRDDSFDSKWNLSGRVVRPQVRSFARCSHNDVPEPGAAGAEAFALVVGCSSFYSAPIEWDLNVFLAHVVARKGKWLYRMDEIALVRLVIYFVHVHFLVPTPWSAINFPF
jgi:hypothetical protein